MIAGASNHVALVGPREQEIVSEARDMVEGRARMLPDSRHLTALLMALEGAEARAKAADSLALAHEAEILELQDDLRLTLNQLGAFAPKDKDVHLRIDWKGENYHVERYFVISYGSFSEFKLAVARRREVERVPFSSSPFPAINAIKRAANRAGA